MIRTKLNLEDGLGQLEESICLLKPTQQLHAASKVIVDGSCVDCISAQSLFSNISCLEISSTSPGRFVHMIQHRAKTAVSEG